MLGSSVGKYSDNLEDSSCALKKGERTFCGHGANCHYLQITADRDGGATVIDVDASQSSLGMRSQRVSGLKLGQATQEMR